MAIREDVVASAITFLQDPSVAAAPLDKRIAFLQSKNLTQEEIDAAMSRAEGGGSVGSMSQNYGYSQPQQMVRQQSPQQYGFGQYPGQAPYWQPPPPELPRRDWRDYFIMATVMSGLSYGVYTVAKRYIVPLIAPPTPAQLTADKATIDASFAQAFSLIDQLAADTASLRASETARTERLDAALADVESTIGELKTASRRRDDDTRRIADEVQGLQGMIPKAMKAQEETTDARLKELTAELKSLKTLVANRMAPPPPPSASSASVSAGQRGAGGGANMFGPLGTANVVGGGNTTGAIADAAAGTPAGTESGGSTTATTTSPSTTSTDTTTTTTNNNKNPSTSSTQSSYNRFSSGRAGIPAWQLAASKKASEEQNNKEKDVVVKEDGAAAAAA